MRLGCCRLLLGLVLLTCGAGLTSGAGAAAAEAPLDQDRAAAAFERAMDHYQMGRLGEAAGLLRGFLVSYGDSLLTDAAYLQLARIHADLAEPEQALAYLAKVSPTARTEADRLLEAQLRVQIGDAGAALGQLLATDYTTLPLAAQQTYWLTLAASAEALDQHQRTLYFLYRALLSDGAETPAEVLARARSLMADRFTEAELDEAVFLYGENPLGALAMLQLGWRAVADNRKDQAREWVAAVLAGSSGFAYRDEALSLQSQLTEPGQLQRAVGVLLPLSGRYAAFGELVKRGMELAQTAFRPALPVRFIYRDTAADAAQAERQLAELAISERVVAVAGPLVGSAAQAAARRANREQVPMLTLSQKEGLAASGFYVFRNALTGALQVRALADYAMGERGLTRFAMLYPETGQGTQLADQFSAEIARRGGSLVARQSYAPEQTDFRREVRLLLGLDPDAADEDEDEIPVAAGEVSPPKEPPPFEALLIPDYAERIALIAPQLVFYGLEGAQLLGTNGWNDPQLVQQAGAFVEKAVFVDGFFRYSPYPFVKDFTERYYAAYGSEPTILEAQGYDVAGILLSLLSRPEIQSRDALRRALLDLDNYPGVTGATRFDFQGEAVKSLFLLQVRDGAIVQIN